MKLFLTLIATSALVSTNVLCMDRFTVPCPEDILTEEVVDRARHFTQVKPSLVEISGLKGCDSEFATKLSARLQEAMGITSHGARDNLAVTFDWSKISDSIVVPPDTGLFQSLLEQNNNTVAKFTEFNRAFNDIKAQKSTLDETVAQQGLKLQEYAHVTTKFDALTKEHAAAQSQITELKASLVQKDEVGTLLLNDHMQLTEQLNQLKNDFSSNTQDYQNLQTRVEAQNTKILSIQELLTKANEDLAEGNRHLEEAKSRRTILKRATDPVSVVMALASGLAVYYYMKNEN